MFHAERIESALRVKVLSFPRKQLDRIWTGVLLTSGSAALEEPDRLIPIEAPAVLWATSNPDNVLRIHAGSEGVQISMNEQTLFNAIGHNPEAPELRRLVEQNFVLNQPRESPSLRKAEEAFDAFLEETKSKTPGAYSIIEAYIKVLLIILWRGSDETGNSLGLVNASNRILRQFRLLLEQHFRERWTVSDYAGNIGISADHLHEVCKQNLGRAPLYLIQERALFEAKQLLATASLTIEQISVQLGYRDPSYFSKQFRKKAGVAPRAYRIQSSVIRRSSGFAATEDFSDWP